MKKISAGLLLYRIANNNTEYFLVHFGGPFWKNKQAGAWSIPKGEVETGEDIFAAALREFTEETGMRATGEFIPLQPVTQQSGKMVYAWALYQDTEATLIKSNLVTMISKTSKKEFSFPEIDKAAWMSFEEGERLIIPAQRCFIRELQEILQKRHRG